MSEHDSTDFAKEIRHSCIRLLTRREHSQQELLDKLELKGFDRNSIQIVVASLANESWQSDERYAEAYARYRMKKGFGPVKITYELRTKGISGFNLDPVVLDIAGSWFDLISQIYQKKYQSHDDLTQKEWLKRSRFLQQRGFSHEQISSVLKKRV